MLYKCRCAHKEGIQKSGDTALFHIDLETVKRSASWLNGFVCLGKKILVTPEKARWALIVDSDTPEKRNPLFQPEI